MSTTEIDNERLGTSIDSTMSTTSTGLMSLLPLIAATSLGTGSPPQIHMDHYSNIYSRDAHVEIEERPSESLQISENSSDNISYASVDYIDTQIEAEREFQILEGFVSEILNDSKPQSSNMKSRMYNNIDDLLIG